jgi:ketopantoate reductase
MKVAVFGAGALGSVYGVRLALRGGVDVTFVVRTARVASTDPIVIESARRNKREEIASPVRSDIVPEDADVVVLTVGTEDLDALQKPLERSPSSPIVILTPMLPKDWSRVRETFGDRALAAMPSVIAYTRKVDGVVRYWTPPAPTRIDEPRAKSTNAEVVRELVDALSRAGLRGHLELGVHEKNPATTVCFIAIGMILSVAGSVDALMSDDALLTLATNACREGVRLSHRIGEAEVWARLAPVLAAPWALRLWLGGVVAKLSPEALFYAEEHFGRKLKDQHRLMIAEMIELADVKGLPHEALDDLGRRLRHAHS